MTEGHDPDDGEGGGAQDGSGSTLTPSGRVTLDFTGPPLALPEDEEGEEPEPAAADAGSGDAGDDPASAAGAAPDAPPLELDTSEFRLPEAQQGEGEGAAELGDAGADAEPLELDTSELEDRSAAHDAWTTDHIRRRSTPPPVAPLPVEAEPPPSPRPARSDADGERPSQPSPRSQGGDALGLVDRQQRSSGEVDLASEMADRYALGDFTGALRAAELLLGREPDHAAAARYAQSSRERLEQLYSSRLGSLESVPQMAVPEGEVRWLGLDHRAGFLVSRIDGAATVEQLVDVSGMARLEALKTLVELLERGVIRF